jgi:hypothetical protein
MSKINYKFYRLGDLFEVKSPSVSSKIDLEEIGCGKYPFVTGQATNNGVEGFYDYFTEEKNVITVDRITYSFIGYQESNFSCNDNVKILKPKFILNKFIALYLCTILKNEKYRYNYGRITSNHRLAETKLKLPATFNGEPNWKYINDYIESVYKNIHEKLSCNSVIEKNLMLKTESWKSFNLIDLFKITGSKTTPLLELEEYGNGKYPFVTTQATTNGVAGFYDYFTEKGNVLVIDSAVIGYCAYQLLDFSASDHVEKLIPKFEMDEYIGLFLTVILNKEQYRYNYGRKASQSRLKQRNIKLPTTSGGKPDWDFMKNYIKSLSYSVNI